MIDTHCHLDLYKDPLAIASECERLGIVTIGMTYLPSHFEVGHKYLLGFKNVRLALGMHPLKAELHEKELPSFRKHLSKTSYIGEIGLDFSREGIATKNLQLDTFTHLMKELSGKKKILSIHSRKAEKEVLALLVEYKIPAAIFHWYSGPSALIPEIVKAGYFFSINTAMTKSKSGQEIIREIPIGNILPESDGPFIEVNGEPARPKDVSIVYKYLATARNLEERKIHSELKNNFRRIISSLSP